jgi:hypothetical protein
VENRICSGQARAVYFEWNQHGNLHREQTSVSPLSANYKENEDVLFLFTRQTSASSVTRRSCLLLHMLTRIVLRLQTGDKERGVVDISFSFLSDLSPAASSSYINRGQPVTMHLLDKSLVSCPPLCTVCRRSVCSIVCNIPRSTHDAL